MRQGGEPGTQRKQVKLHQLCPVNRFIATRQKSFISLGDPRPRPGLYPHGSEGRPVLVSAARLGRRLQGGDGTGGGGGEPDSSCSSL